MTSYGASGALASVEGMPSGGNSTLVYFTCENCANELSRVVGAGGNVMKEKFSIGEYGFIAIAFDTEGNMIGLHSLH
jgi:predicted enzyme related to lactoylglutathione lyase